MEIPAAGDTGFLGYLCLNKEKQRQGQELIMKLCSQYLKRITGTAPCKPTG